MTVLTLSDAGVDVLDCEHKTPQAQPSGFPYIAIPDIQDGRVLLGQARRISKEDLAAWTRRTTPRTGDILVTRRGRVGDTAPIPDGIRCAIGQNLVLLRTNGERADQHYLRWAVRSPQWWGEVDRLLNVGAVFSSLNVRDISRIRLEFPPLPEQQAIAEVLGALDDKIAANTKLAAAAYELVRAEIDSSWLHKGEPCVPVVEFMELNPSSPRPVSPEPPYIDMKRLSERRWTIDGFDRRKAKGGARFMNGDTLLARITPCLENGKTGYVDVLPDDSVGLGSTEFIVLRPREGVASPVPFLIAKEARFRESAIQNMVGTSGRQRVTAADVARFKVPAPDPQWLSEFGRRVTDVFNAVRAAMAENRILAATRDALLPRLMSGEVQVGRSKTSVRTRFDI
ncbi:restriction endonuclease subunit S [Microbacterium kribbense]|uniref:Restriction endonuclease subunit S n=1 Tax=Microbacterium kribbense TaxID=433645 RepID=A0ABP7GTF2_9MICO